MLLGIAHLREKVALAYVVELGTIGAAARAMDCSTNEIGLLLRRIEWLDDRRLFQIDDSSISLTPEGESLAGRWAEAVQLLSQGYEDPRGEATPD